jgi:uncharacterized caspase-like protein
LLLGMLGHAEATSRALLVGVGRYKSPMVRTLEGPVADVQALSAILVQRWRFAPAHVTILKDDQATRDAVLSALRRLVQASQPGDFLLFYYSGHGTSMQDTEFQLPLPDDTGALVPWDFAMQGTRAQQLDSIIVGRRDVRPLLEQADQKGVAFLMITDACFSGYASRSAPLTCPGVLSAHLTSAHERQLSLKAPARG